ncbi:alpha/beta hydrolase family protein [Hirschia litorea]|uniref:Alpha/beta hydrolase family protein n=1 Tax=Hirschia litorea TaxID=1199156 RepID=A0ABW2IKF7_9PROT
MTLKLFNANRLAFVGALGLSVFLTGCFEKEIDESVVFKPRPIETPAINASQMRLENEESLTQPSADELVEARGYASHMPATLTHGFWGEGDSRIAWTLVSSVTSAEKQAKRPLIVNCFGNASDRIRDGVWAAKKSFMWGDVLLFDYPGYGDSGGVATTESMHDMQLLVSDNVDELGADRPVIMWGHSLGGFVCSELARTARETDAVVLEATALNVKEVAEAWTPWYLPFVGVDIKDSLNDYDNARALAHFDGPIIVLGAKKDETLPVGLARSLHKALKKRDLNVSYFEFRKAEHSTITDQFDFQKRINPLLEDVRDLKNK